MDSTPRNATPTREEEANLLKEVQEIFNKFFKWLFSIIAFKITDIGEAFFTTHPNEAMAIVLAIVFYFLAWLLGTILQRQIRRLLPIITSIILTIGSIASSLSLIIILLPSA